MKALKYIYEVDDDFIVIDDLLGGESVLLLIEQVLAEIEEEAGPVGGKYIIWRGSEGIWDLLLPQATRTGVGIPIYPLSTFNLDEAKIKLRELVTYWLHGGADSGNNPLT